MKAIDHLHLFDFDGVLFDTNRIKTEAFAEALSRYPADEVSRFLEYHKQHGGISRHEKIRYFFQEIIRTEDSQSQQEEVLVSFGQICKAKLPSARPLPGVVQFLMDKLRSRTPCAILSGGNELEIRSILNTHEMGGLFREIWANDKSKAVHAEESVQAKYRQVTFFGDARYDFEVSKAFKFDFVYVACVSEWPEGRGVAESAGYRVIQDFRELL